MRPLFMQGQERTADSSITIDKQLLVGDILANQPPHAGKHGHSAMCYLRFPPASDLLYRGGVVQQVERIEHFGKWLADSWQSLGICKATAAGVRDISYPKVTQSCPTVNP